ncbi:hypothetical protein LX15_003888 [Streptoalloteichus tenebrarius]|uniref:Uncharacterized protein n=1 Tax=Streptoalloteichus tenebrarius (strain ATCC 17920 / DSM 40477 / JCM 4838 / CBS 697.72 / NBRC 16177 / NCIMB 11028 / NRRL B-12390 / A12253. 1 / ISP 5477) TaxID=1933 RepID=A0ABT1HXE6_STRSD|nr:hypothetical protein [Streptoalloteichus tenebrarius]
MTTGAVVRCAGPRRRGGRRRATARRRRPQRVAGRSGRRGVGRPRRAPTMSRAEPGRAQQRTTEERRERRSPTSTRGGDPRARGPEVVAGTRRRATARRRRSARVGAVPGAEDHTRSPGPGPVDTRGVRVVVGRSSRTVRVGRRAASARWRGPGRRFPRRRRPRPPGSRTSDLATTDEPSDARRPLRGGVGRTRARGRSTVVAGVIRGPRRPTSRGPARPRECLPFPGTGAHARRPCRRNGALDHVSGIPAGVRVSIGSQQPTSQCCPVR